MISKFFEILFNKWMTKHDKICLKRELNKWWCLMIKEERCIERCLIFNKKDEICLLIDVRTQIYESQSSSKNKEQTWELFFNTIIKFSDENLSLWELKHWVYKKFYCRFSETLSLQEFLSSIFRNSEFTRI